jgi:NAD(P)-dependent dehydrogenase (short-subunit alcohol dehydrogenase family)
MTTPLTLFDLRGRVAVLTGATGLLGRRHADTLAAAGADLVLVDLDQGATEAFATEVSRLHARRAIGVGADVGTPSGADLVRERTAAEFANVGILVNNVMAKPPGYYATVESYGVEAWDRTFAGNVTSILLLAQRLAPLMTAGPGGVIINVASVYGLVAPDQRLYDGVPNPYGEGRLSTPPSYAASKAAVVNLTRYLASYYGRSGIRVNTLTPGGVADGQDAAFVQRYAERTMLGRMAAPDDYCGALLFLASDASAYMTGANLVVDGGWTAW